LAGALGGALFSAGLAGVAHAGPDSMVTSALDPDDGFDLHLSLDYDFVIRRSAVRRERISPDVTPTDATQVVNDLLYESSRHVLTPRLELGIFHDLWLYGALPIVIGDQRSLSFDQRESPCASGCVDRTNSSTIADGILPGNGFDADDPTGPGFTSTTDPMIFRGPTRHGLDQIHAGLGWAPMNQDRDPTKPTWKLGAELRAAVGPVARFDRNNPGSETGVGQGVHEVNLWTSMARRLGWAEPFIEIWWQAPIGLTDDSPFRDPGFGARQVGKQQEAGAVFGFEAIAVNRPADHQRVGIELSARMVGRFEGRAYSEMWEVLAFAGDQRASGPLVLDADPGVTGLQALSHPGISNVENHLEMGGRLALRAELGRWVHIAALAQLTTETSHTITFADAGVDFPRCPAGGAGSCEEGENEVVNPNTPEVNPVHAARVDLVGHRYQVGDVLNLSAGVEAWIFF